MKKIRLLLLPFLTFAMSLASCNKAGGGNQNVEVSAVKLDQTSITLDVGSSKQLTATVEPDNATDKTVTWSTSDNSIASVSNGLVRGAKKGTAIITATAGDKNATCNVTVNEVVIAKALQALKVTPPSKTAYYVGESLDLAGLKVIAVYTDRSEETLTADKYTVTGFDSSAAVANQTITVSYTYESKTKTATFNVAILEKPAPVVESIEVTQNPTKVEYEIGDDLDTNGLVITATYNDGTTKVVTGYTLSGFSSRVAGTVTVTVTFEGKSATFTITIKEAPTIVTITGIEVTTMPTKVNYEIGEALDTTGMVVKATKSDGTSEEVTGWKVDGFTSETAGEKTVGVTWKDAANNEYITTFKVTVLAAPVLQSIKLNVANAKVEYEYNEDLDTSGVVVTATYDRGAEKTIAIGDCEVTGFTKGEAGEQTITVTYEDKSDTYKVTVKERVPVLQGIVLDITNVKVSYEFGEDADFSGLVVKKHYDVGDDVVLESSEYTITGFDSSSAGEKTITVTYEEDDEEYTKTFTVTVAPEVTLDSIEITAMPTKTSYMVGEELSTAGMEVTAHYSDQSTQVVTGYTTSGFDSSAIAADQIVTVTYLTKTATFTVQITKWFPDVGNNVLAYKVNEFSDWHTAELVVNPNNDKELMLENKINLPAGTIFAFHLQGNTWKMFDDLKDTGKHDNFKDNDGFLEVKEGLGGDYQFYIDTTAEGKSIHVDRILHHVALKATYANDFVFVGNTIDVNALTVKFVEDDGSEVNLTPEEADEVSFYRLVADTRFPFDETVTFYESDIGEVEIYAHYDAFITEDKFTFEVAYQYAYQYSVDGGTSWNEVQLTDANDTMSETTFLSKMLETTADDALVKVYRNGLLVKPDADHKALGAGISIVDGVITLGKAGDYVVGVDKNADGVMAYNSTWHFAIKRYGQTPEMLIPTAVNNLQFEFKNLVLQEDDEFMFARGDANDPNVETFGFNTPSNFYQNRGQNEYFSAGMADQFVVEDRGVYSFYLKHYDFTYGQTVKSPQLYVVKEDLWHADINGVEFNAETNPYNKDEAALVNVSLVAGDVLFFSNVENDSGYSKLGDDACKSHFDPGTGADEGKMVVKDGHAGAYSFYIVRSTGVIWVVYESVTDQDNFNKASRYIVGNKDFSTGVSTDSGTSWNKTDKSMVMVEDETGLSPEYATQYKATIKFAAGDKWRVRNNMYIKTVAENAGAISNGEMAVAGDDIQVNTAGTYEIYVKEKANGYCSLYVAEQADYTLSTSSVTLHKQETFDVAVLYSHDEKYGSSNITATVAQGDENIVSTSVDGKTITLTGGVEGTTTVTVSDGRTLTDKTITVKVLPADMPLNGYGLSLVRSTATTYVETVAAGQDGEGRNQYKVDEYHFLAGDTFKITDFGNGNIISASIEAASFATHTIEDYVVLENDVYTVQCEFYANVYVKLKQGSDRIYFDLYDIKLNSVRDNANEEMDAEDVGFAYATMYIGALHAEVLQGGEGVIHIDNVNQENGKIDYTALAAGSATIRIYDDQGTYERTISFTVNPKEHYFLTGDLNGWTTPGTIELTKVANDEYVIENVSLADGAKFKVYWPNGATEQAKYISNANTYTDCGYTLDGDKNIIVEGDGVYTIHLYFNETAQTTGNHVTLTKTDDLVKSYSVKIGETTYPLTLDQNATHTGNNTGRTAVYKATIPSVTAEQSVVFKINDVFNIRYFANIGGDNYNNIYDNSGLKIKATVNTAQTLLLNIMEPDGSGHVYAKSFLYNGEELARPWYLAGTFNDWTNNDDNYKLMADEYDKNRFYIENVNLINGDAIKMYNPSTSKWQGNGAGNEEGNNYVINQTGAYTIFFYADHGEGNHIQPSRTGDNLALRLSGGSVTVNAGYSNNSVTVVNYSGELSVSSDKENIATAIVDGTTIIITGKPGASGSAVITVSSTGNANTCNIAVTVNATYLVTFTLDATEVTEWNPATSDFSIYIALNDGTKLLGEFDAVRGNVTLNGNTGAINVYVPTGKSITMLVVYFYQGNDRKQSIDYNPSIDAAGAYTFTIKCTSWPDGKFDGSTLTPTNP